MKKRISAILLSAALMVSNVAAAEWAPIDFGGGSLSGIVTDGKDVLVSDVFNKVIWKVDEDNEVEQYVGQISVLDLDGAPIGKYADGTRTTALFKQPWAMAPYLNGYAVTDTGANVVRWFDDAAVYTAAGSGKAGDADGTGIRASFDAPTGLAAGEKGELYIADTGNGSIRVMDTQRKVTTLVEGLEDPTGLYYRNATLYVAETGKNRIISIKTRTGKMSVVAGLCSERPNEDGIYEGAYVDGPVEKACFDHPQGVSVGKDGTIYVADTGNGAVRKISNGRVTTLQSARQSTQTLVMPRSILIRDNALWVSDLFCQTLVELDLTPVTFDDIPVDAWYTSFVEQAVEIGLVSGTGEGKFSPDTQVTRGMFVVMLSKLHQYTDGGAVINGASSFTDVPAGAWYAPAVRWAADLGIVGGYGDGQFGPNDPVTREQLAVMLHNYARIMDYEPDGSADLTLYSDSEQVSGYAVPALNWACGSGILSGMSGNLLAPKTCATRVQTAVMLINTMNALGL